MPMWMRIALNWDVVYAGSPAGGSADPRHLRDETPRHRGRSSARRTPATRPFHPDLLLRRTGFLDQADLPPETSVRYRSLATLRHLRDRGGQGAPWTETTRGLVDLVRLRPSILFIHDMAPGGGPTRRKAGSQRGQSSLGVGGRAASRPKGRWERIRLAVRRTASPYRTAESRGRANETSSGTGWRKQSGSRPIVGSSRQSAELPLTIL